LNDYFDFSAAPDSPQGQTIHRDYFSRHSRGILIAVGVRSPKPASKKSVKPWF